MSQALASSVSGRLVRGGRRLARHVGRGLLDMLYPPRCLACQARLSRARAPLCAACVAGLERAPSEVARQRLHALPSGSGTAIAAVFPLWRFDPDGALQALQHALKYQNRPRYGRVAGRWMGRALAETLSPPPEAVVPVPLHRTRKLERGYNQSARLARGVAERLGVPCRPGWLDRPHPTRSQTHLSRQARWENVDGAFSAPRSLDGRPLLLVDDVLTTGATGAAAARALRHAGAGPVYLATLAMAE